MTRYADRTDVPVERTQGEIKRLVTQYKATGYGIIEHGRRAAVVFEMHDRRVRFMIEMPRDTEDRFRYRSDNQRLPVAQGRAAWEQEIRSLWRALYLTIKAKLVSVESHVESFEEAFAAQVVLPDDRTVGEWLLPQLADAYRTDQMPPLLPGASAGPAILLPPAGESR